MPIIHSLLDTDFYKFAIVRSRPLMTVSDFGTRRADSREWHDRVVASACRVLGPQFRGTSNVYLARKYGVTPMGTVGHEVFMVVSALAPEGENRVRFAHQTVVPQWHKKFGPTLLILLPDTFTTPAFLRDVPLEYFGYARGFRPDSGDPYVEAHRIIDHLKRHDIDPMQKLIMFADALTPTKMVELYDHFVHLTRPTHGWGTDLTSDLVFPPVSIVTKPVWANGRGIAKLSDNIAKATGDPAVIEEYARYAESTVTYFEECKY